jgi:hypothetical protein
MGSVISKELDKVTVGPTERVSAKSSQCRMWIEVCKLPQCVYGKLDVQESAESMKDEEKLGRDGNAAKERGGDFVRDWLKTWRDAPAYMSRLPTLPHPVALRCSCQSPSTATSFRFVAGRIFDFLLSLRTCCCPVLHHSK